jgi:hypothetical protein
VPHLENEHMPDECFVQRTLAKPVQVVQVTDLTPTSSGGALLRQRLFECGRGQGR